MKVLIVYDSRLGSVKNMARLIARGVESGQSECEAVLRCVKQVSSHDINDNQSQNDKNNGDTNNSIASTNDSDLFASLDDLKECDALIVGSPTRFGNMSASMKHFLDSTSALWMSGALSGKPAAVFTSSSSMHGGQESTLLSMLNPLLHHGMVICGLPFSEPALSKTTTGGTPYGASHVAGSNNTLPISSDERALCLALGKRISHLTIALNSSEND